MKTLNKIIITLATVLTIFTISAAGTTQNEITIITSEDKQKQIEYNVYLEGNDKYITNGYKGILISDNDVVIYTDKNDIDGTVLDSFITKYNKTNVYDYKNISLCINTDKNIYELFPNYNDSDYSIEYDSINDLLIDTLNYI